MIEIMSIKMPSSAAFSVCLEHYHITRVTLHSWNSNTSTHILHISNMKSAALLIAAGSGIVLAQDVVTEIPAPAGTSLSPEPIVVSDSFDGEGFLYDREGTLGILILLPENSY